jgi:hypothetical protein
MPMQIWDGTTKVVADSTLDSMRVSSYPCEASVWDLVTLASGNLTGVAASNSTGTVWSLRQVDTSILLVRRLGLSWLTTTGYTGAQYQDWGVSVVRPFQNSDSGGTAWSSASNNSKVRTSLGTPTSIDLRIAGTAALTAGGATRTPDTNVIAQCGCNNAAATAGGLIPFVWLIDQGPGDYPIVLAQNEGLIIWPQTAMGTGGVGTLTVTVEFAQATAY